MSKENWVVVEENDTIICPDCGGEKQYDPKKPWWICEGCYINYLEMVEDSYDWRDDF